MEPSTKITRTIMTTAAILRYHCYRSVESATRRRTPGHREYRQRTKQRSKFAKVRQVKLTDFKCSQSAGIYANVIDPSAEEIPAAAYPVIPIAANVQFLWGCIIKLRGGRRVNQPAVDVQVQICTVVHTRNMRQFPYRQDTCRVRYEPRTTESRKFQFTRYELSDTQVIGLS